MAEEVKEEAEVKEEVVNAIEAPTAEPVSAPVTKTPEQERFDLITRLAEDIHPGCWDLRSLEPQLCNTVYGGYVSMINSYGTEGCGDCPECDDGCPEDCENIDRSTNPNGLKRLMIRFPEVTIRNSRDYTYDIKDFYIAIILNKDLSKASTRSLFAIRTTATTKEYSNGFFHPHASRRSGHCGLSEYFQWRELCLGGQTELTDMMCDMYDTINEKLLHELLVTLHIYAGWESIEGGPYQRMETVQYPARSSESMPSMDYAKYQSMFYDLVLKCTDHGIQRPEIIGSGNDYAITNINDSIIPLTTKTMIDYIAQNVREDHRERYNAYLGVYDETGNWQSIRQTGNTSQPVDFYVKAVELAKGVNTPNVIQFREEPLQFVLELDETGLTTSKEITQEIINNATMHPDYVTDMVNNYLRSFKEFKLKITL